MTQPFHAAAAFARNEPLTTQQMKQFLVEGLLSRNYKRGTCHNMPPVLLELFSGTGSIGRAFEALGWDVISVDIDPRANATYCCDVLEFDYRCIEQKVDVIWASPPCQLFSNARTKGCTADLESADSLVLRTLEIAEGLGNPTLFVENPHSGKLKRRGLLDHLSMRVLDYCRFGMPYRKRTSVWTSTTWVPSQPLCKHDCPSSVNGNHLARAQQGPPGPRFSQRQLYMIPAKLCDEIAEFCSNLIKK